MCLQKELQCAINRIEQMELYLEEVLRVKDVCFGNINEDVRIQQMLEKLRFYYESGQWLEDYERDERGELPTNLKRGVLSQDTLYDLLSEKER